MPTFAHDGLTFHYRDVGDGVPFLFQHGLGADTSQTFSLYCPPNGIRLITLDCRGHGLTSPLGPEEKLTIPQFAIDLTMLLDHLKLERAVIGGISMGAATSLHLAITKPERFLGLVLSRPAWLDEPRGSSFEIFGVVAQLIRRYGAWEGAIRFQASEIFQTIKQASADNALSLLAQFAHPRAEETVAKLEWIPKHHPSHPRDAWRDLRMPTLVLGNRMDAIHPFEFAEEHAHIIPGALLRELTPKSVNKEQHTADTQRFLDDFLTQFRPT